MLGHVSNIIRGIDVTSASPLIWQTNNAFYRAGPPLELRQSLCRRNYVSSILLPPQFLLAVNISESLCVMHRRLSDFARQEVLSRWPTRQAVPCDCKNLLISAGSRNFFTCLFRHPWALKNPDKTKHSSHADKLIIVNLRWSLDDYRIVAKRPVRSVDRRDSQSLRLTDGRSCLVILRQISTFSDRLLTADASSLAWNNLTDHGLSIHWHLNIYLFSIVHRKAAAHLWQIDCIIPVINKLTY